MNMKRLFKWSCLVTAQNAVCVIGSSWNWSKRKEINFLFTTYNLQLLDASFSKNFVGAERALFPGIKKENQNRNIEI